MNPSMGDKLWDSSFQEIVGDSPALKHLLQMAIKAAGNDASLLILGESGSGKESIARAIHRISRRGKESFVKVNCAAGNERLAALLFGNARETADNPDSRKTGGVQDANLGNAIAFPRYREEIGCLEMADQGILFLDEIANLCADLQARLLGLLRNGEFQRRGLPSVRINVRLIASTKYDLAERVAEQAFLSDLYDRLNVFPIRVPSLRERREDVPILARYFMQKFARRMNKEIESIPTEAISFLMNSDWPGNIRQLENLIEQAVISTDGRTLQVPTQRA
jgi:formate hydrogenlyase transcriptional activator